MKMTKEKQTEVEFIDEALERYKEIEEFEASARLLMREDLKFAYRDQWLDEDKTKRDGENRPVPIIRRSKQFLDHIKNEQRENKPQIKVSPVDDGAQEVFAKNRQGVIRHIHYDSKAPQAIQRAKDFAVDMGRGWFRIVTEHVHNKTFDQKLAFKPVKDMFSVYMESKHDEFDYSDCRWGFVLQSVQRDEFKEMYPDKDVCEWTEGAKNPWIFKDYIVLAEYYLITKRDRELWRVDIDGVEENIFKDDISDPKKFEGKVINKRTIEDDYVHWYYLSGKEILEQNETVFNEIPLIPVLGEETIIDTIYDVKGVTRDLIDPGRLYNFLNAQEMEIVANAPKTLFIGAQGQFENHEEEFENINDSSTAYVEYAPVSHDGHLAPPPQRADQVPIPAGLVQAKQECIGDMQAITGFYDAQAGNRSNETSGVAIRQRVNQGNTASYHFSDNGDISLTKAGRILNHAIPIVYKPGRLVTIMGEDDEESQLEIGGTDEQGMETGFGDGEFAVVVSVGPSYNTKREEATVNMIETSKVVPAVGQSSPDLMIKAQDWPLKDEIAERAKRFVEMQFPGLTAPIEQDNDEMAQLVEQMKQLQGQLQQMGQEREQLVAQLEKIDQDKNRTEAMKAQKDLKELDLKAKEIEIKAQEVALEAEKINADTQKADLTASTDMEKAKLQADTTIKVKRMEIAATTATKEGANKENKVGKPA